MGEKCGREKVARVGHHDQTCQAVAAAPHRLQTAVQPTGT